MWAWLPDELVKRITELAHLLALRAMVHLEKRCARIIGKQLASCRALTLPPFSLKAAIVLGKRQVPAKYGIRILSLSNRELGDAGLTALADACSLGAFAPIDELTLFKTRLGDAGIVALAKAGARGALPELKLLELGTNEIGPVGIEALADACVAGAFEKLSNLRLDKNQIGENGAMALASAITRGALPSLQGLFLSWNQIGDAGVSALANACTSSHISAELKVLFLNSNGISDAGVQAFVNACTSTPAIGTGANPGLPRLTILALDGQDRRTGNQIGDTGFAAITSALAVGALPALGDLRLPRHHRGRVARDALVSQLKRSHRDNFRPSSFSDPNGTFLF